MAKKDEKGNWLDPRGKGIPQKYIPTIERQRDKAVEDIHAIVDKLEAQMQKAKVAVLDRIESYLVGLEKECNAKREGKGNLTLTNFSGDKQVDIAINDLIDFDERLSLAKTKIDACLTEWSEGSRDEIAMIVRQAFNLDKKGNVNKGMIVRLLGYEIKDARWKEAMDLIRHSMQVRGTKQYLKVRRKEILESGSEQWTTANLNFSAM